MASRVGLRDAEEGEDQSNSSSGDEEQKHPQRALSSRGPMALLFLAVLATLIVGAIFFITGRSHDSHDSQCLGYDKCPDYPGPYLFGQWPETYDVAGSFPEDFIFGLGTSSYQIEGAYREDGRGASIWDTFTGANTVGMPGADCSYCCKAAPCPINPAMFDKGATGNVACDTYHTVEEDVAMMKSMGLRHYRFSVAWPRIFPTGFSKDGVNEKGVAYYNKLIDALLAAGITPYITLYHWDLPQGLLDPPRWQGWWSRDNVTGEPNGQIIDEFVAFADVCFRSYGDRVKTWMTFNEAWTFTYLASGYGKAPSIPEFGNMSTDPYIAGHNVLNAHAAVVDLYRKKYQATQGGKIGITNNCDWKEPRSDAPADVAAADRTVLFQLGWFADPIYFGDYPEPMKRLYGDRLPKFTEDQKKLIKGSTDFFGLNHYGTGWAAFAPDKPGDDTAYANVTEQGFLRAESQWLYSAGWGLRKLLNWVSRRYGHPAIYITEGGWSLAANNAEDGVADPQRTAYYANYTSEVRKAIVEDGLDVRSYFAWSLMDNFEWERGYVERFGTTYNDFAFGPDPNSPVNADRQPTAGQQLRRRKDSNCWLETLWTNNSLLDPSDPAFKGCVDAGVFEGDFADSSNSVHTITLGQPTPHQVFFDVAGTISVTVPPFNLAGTVPAQFSGGTIVADFSSVPAWGKGKVSGYWNRTAKAIHWADGAVWTAVES